MAHSWSLAQKRTGLLIYLLWSLCTIPSKETWARCDIVKDNFWEATDKLLLTFPPPIEDNEEEKNNKYLLFNDHPEGEDVLIS